MLEQFASSHPDNKFNASLTYPFYINGMVLGNDLREINCYDKNGMKSTIQITTHTSVRIIQKDNSKTTFYFNTLLIKDSLITGSKSHFAEIKIQPINLNNIALIEVQK
jgi:hypothetical protein